MKTGNNISSSLIPSRLCCCLYLFLLLLFLLFVVYWLSWTLFVVCGNWILCLVSSVVNSWLGWGFLKTKQTKKKTSKSSSLAEGICVHVWVPSILWQEVYLAFTFCFHRISRSTRGGSLGPSVVFSEHTFNSIFPGTCQNFSNLPSNILFPYFFF